MRANRFWRKSSEGGGAPQPDGNRSALDAGATLKGIFGLVRRLRQKTDEPLLLMLYLNSIFRFGTEHFFRLCAECGIDGVIVPDMPYEERDEIQAEADAFGLIPIRMVAPTSDERIAQIAPFCQRLFVLRFLHGRHRNAEQFFDRLCRILRHHPKICQNSLRGRLRHLRPGAGEANGLLLRRCDCRERHCENR